MSHWIKLYLIAIPILVGLDLLWIGVIARDFYREGIGHLLAPQIRWEGALLFYLFYPAGVLFFACSSSISVGEALIRGGLLGLLAYSTYDFTNFATLQGWPLRVVIVDILWGTALTAALSAIMHKILMTMNPS